MTRNKYPLEEKKGEKNQKSQLKKEFNQINNRLLICTYLNRYQTELKVYFVPKLVLSFSDRLLSFQSRSVKRPLRFRRSSAKLPFIYVNIYAEFVFFNCCSAGAI